MRTGNPSPCIPAKAGTQFFRSAGCLGLRKCVPAGSGSPKGLGPGFRRDERFRVPGLMTRRMAYGLRRRRACHRLGRLFPGKPFVSMSAVRAALGGAALLALAACATAPAVTATVPAPVEPAVVVAPERESTAFTLGTDQPRTPEQLALRLDKADLSIKVIPDDKAIDAVAVLDFTATAPVSAVVVELDTRLTVSSVQVDPSGLGQRAVDTGPEQVAPFGLDRRGDPR